jgi:purine-binding chemotaxis protein CheW
MAECSDFVTLSLGNTLYGIPVERVQEILDMRPVAPMPNAPAHLLGVTDLRGENVPVIDMRTLLGMGSVPDTLQTRILVVLLRRNGAGSVIGLRTDRVIDVVRLDDDALNPLTEAQKLAWDGLSVLGIGRRNGEVISIIDLDGLFASIPRAATATSQVALPDMAA